MTARQVFVYMNDNRNIRLNLLDYLDQWGINYQIKDIAKHPEYLKELHEEGIYGTPATFIDGKPVLGFQKDKLKRVLGA